MFSIRRLSARSDNSPNSPGMSELTTDLLAALLGLVLTSLLLIGILFGMRRYRRSKQAVLPMHNDPTKLAPRKSHHKRNPSSVTITTMSPSGVHSQALYVLKEQQQFLHKKASVPPPSNLPEIRITLPEEVDNDGQHQAGRVVVVHMGENGVGMQPVEENLPPYQKNASDRFQSLDLERIGGLKEKS